MDNIKVCEFQKEYYMLNNEFEKRDKELFNLGILVAYTSEIQNGYMVKKQLKTNAKGTKFTYKAIENQEEADKYMAKIRKMSDELDHVDILNKRIEELQERFKND